jgi:raffinose/stachyose/melibiose transport system permease protein
MKSRKKLFWFVLPAVLVFTVFTFIPLLNAIRISFTEFSGVGVERWVGLENYKTILTNPTYLGVLKVTLIYSCIVVVLQNAIALCIAALLYSTPSIRSFARVALLVPSMYSAVIAAYIWEFIYSPLGGGLNELLRVIGMESSRQIWLGDPSIALYSVSAVQIWMYVGYSTAIFLAGFLAIPQEIHDAAKMDGANSIQRFFKIDVPMLAPAFTVNITLSTIGTLKAFEMPLVLTHGGPDGATTTIGLQFFNTLFGEYKFGLASALAIVILLLTLAVTYIQNLYLARREINL